MKLEFYAGVKYGDRIFFSEYSCLKGLFSMNHKGGEVKFLKTFEKETAMSRLHRMAFIYGHEAWFIPEEAEHIVCLNLETLDMEYYKVPCHMKNTNKVHGDYSTYTSGFVLKERYICLIPREIDTVLLIDMELHKMYPFYHVVDPEKERIADGLAVGDDLYLFPERGEGYTQINLTTGKRITLTRTDRAFVPGCVCETGGKIWFAPWEKGDIVCKSISDGKEYLLSVPEKGNLYYRMIDTKNKLIFLPFKATGFLVVDKSTLKTEILHLCEDVSDGVICTVIGFGGEILIAAGAKGRVFSLDKDAGKLEIIPVEIAPADLCRQVIAYVEKAGSIGKNKRETAILSLKRLFGGDAPVVYENEGMTALTRLVGFGCLTDESGKSESCIQKAGQGSIGKGIWNKLKSIT